MPRKHQMLSLSDLPFEPMAKDSTATAWTMRMPAPAESDQVRLAVDSLSQREREVIQRRFGLRGDPETLDAIGCALGCSRERIRQLQQSALRNLKRRLTR